MTQAVVRPVAVPVIDCVVPRRLLVRLKRHHHNPVHKHIAALRAAIGTTRSEGYQHVTITVGALRHHLAVRVLDPALGRDRVRDVRGSARRPPLLDCRQAIRLCKGHSEMMYPSYSEHLCIGKRCQLVVLTVQLQHTHHGICTQMSFSGKHLHTLHVCDTAAGSGWGIAYCQ